MTIQRPSGVGTAASQFALQSTGTAVSVDNLQEVHDYTRAAGHLDGGAITDAGGGTINVASGEGFIRANPDDVSTLFAFTWPAATGLTIPTDTIRYVVVEYNAGAPQVVLFAAETYDYQTAFPLGIVVNEGGTLFINDTPHSMGRASGRFARRNYEVDGRSRADQLGGLIISESATAKTLAVTTGVTWLRGIRDVFPAFDSNGTDRFDRYYRDGVGGWTREAAQQFVPDGGFDDGDGTLGTIANNNYGTYWFYLGPGNGIVMVYGRIDVNTLAAAQADTPPPDLPLRLQVGSLFLGRMIMRRTPGPTFTIVQVDSAFTTQFQVTPITDHGGLAGLGDDDHPQYHLRADGVVRQVSAGAEAVSSGSISLADSNGVSFGLNAGTLTASHDGLTSQSTQFLALTLGGNSAGVSTFHASNNASLFFHGGNNITLSGNGSTITISGAAAGDAVRGVAANGSTLTTGTVNFSNSNGISFGFGAAGNSTVITGSHNALTSQSNQALSGQNGSFTFQTASFSNANGISFGTSAGPALTASHNALTTAALSNHSHGASGQNGSFGFQTLSFSNANGISIGTSAGPAVTFSHNALTTAALSNHSHGNPQLNLTNLSGTTASNSAGLTLSLSAAAAGGGGIAASAAGNSVSSGTVVWSNSNNVSFGMAGSTITATAAGGAAAQPSRRWARPDAMRFGSMNLVTNITAISSRAIFWPWFHEAGDITISRVNWQMSRAATGSNLFSAFLGIYTYVNDTQISLLGSVSGSYSNTLTVSVSGIRRFAMSGLPAAISTLAPRGYVIGMMFAAAATASMNYSLMGEQTTNAVIGAILEGADQYNTATSFNFFPFLGRYTVNSAALPNSVADSQVIGQFTGASHFIQPWMGFNND